MQTYALILAGGSGKRLWPLGRQKLPKQLIPFQGERTLLDLTIDRMALLVPRENIWIITVPEYAALIKQNSSDKVGRILVELEARNTGPAIFYAMQELYKHDPSATLIVTPSDQVIHDAAQFLKALDQACDYAFTSATIVSCGVVPTHPATGYGYIEYDNNRVVRFHEKPTLEVAEEYCKKGSFLWNTGIFCTTLQTLSDEFKKLTLNNYSTLPAESIDYMIFEKSSALSVVKGAFDWSDVGTLDLFIAAQKDISANLITMNAQNVIAHGSKKLIVVMDVDDICIIETDDVLLVTRRSEPEKIKNAVEYLKRHGYEEFT